MRGKDPGRVWCDLTHGHPVCFSCPPPAKPSRILSARKHEPPFSHIIHPNPSWQHQQVLPRPCWSLELCWGVTGAIWGGSGHLAHLYGFLGVIGMARMHLSCCRSPCRALPSHVTFGTRRRSTYEHPFGLHLTHLPRKAHPASRRRHGSGTEAFCKCSQPDCCWVQVGMDPWPHQNTLRFPGTRSFRQNRVWPRDREGVINPCKRE